MATKRLAFASILIGLFMALSLMPGLAFAAADGSNAQGEELQIQPQTTNSAASRANQANGDASLQANQTSGGETLQTTQTTGSETTQLAPASNGESSQSIQAGGNDTPPLAQANGDVIAPATEPKPSQAIQASHMSVFTTDTGKNLNANMVEGKGALSYAVKRGGDCVSVDSNGALKFRKAGEAIVTVTAAETETYAQTSIDVPITIYDHFDYTFTVGNTLDCVDYYGHYPINKLEIKLKNGNNVVGSATINSPKKGSSVTISATGFAKRIEMTAEIQQRKNTRSASETLDLNGGGRFEIEMNSRGTIVLCDYGITLPEPDYVAPVAKPNLSSTGQNQLLIYPGSVLSGGQHMEYTFGTKDAPNNNGWTDNYGFMRAKDPGDYYVWWKTASRDRRSLMYFSGGRLDTAPQCVKVTIGKGSINPTVTIDDWTYGETPKTPTVSGNTGNGAVTYEYKARGADDDTYSTTVPTNAGDYTVRATIAESKTHNGGSATKDFTIAKATVPNQDVRVVGYVRSVDSSPVHWEANIEQSLAGMMPNDAGTLTYVADAPIYKNGATTLPDGVTSFKSGVDTNGMVTARLEIPSSAVDIPEGVQEITLPVTVSAQKNYKDATIKVVVVPTKREEKTVTIAGVPNSKTKIFGDVPFTLTATVKDNGTVVDTKKGDWYWYSSDPNVLEVPPVTSSYSASNEMPVTVKGPGSAQILAWYEPSDSNTIGAALTESITVDKAEITPSVTLAGWTFGDTANTPSVAGNTDNGAVTFEYKAKDADDSTYATAVPTHAGDYTVRATVSETAHFKGNACTADFTIAKKPITATVTAEDKTYDGTTVANVVATVNKSDLVEGDLLDGVQVEGNKVTIAELRGAFGDANAGEGKTVELDYEGVVSPVADAANYEVSLSGTPTATINKRPIEIEAANRSSRYGAPIAGLTYGLCNSTTLAEGDTLASLGITASTTATSKSNVGEYPITLSGGTANPNYKVTFHGGAMYSITQAQGLTKSIRVVGFIDSIDDGNNTYHYETNVKQSLANMMPGEAGVLKYEAGMPAYADNTSTLPSDVASFVSSVDSSTGEVTAKLTIPSSANDIPAQVRQITLPVKVESKNYEESTINVVVVPTKKKEQKVTIAGDFANKTYGDGAFELTATVENAQGEPMTTGESDWYWYSSDPNVLEVANVQGSGKMSVTVKNPGSAQILAWYEPSGSNEIGAALTDPITVGKASINPSISVEGWTYGEEPKTPALAEGSNPGSGDFVFEYKAKGAEDDAYTTAAPTQAGTYLVRGVVAETENHLGGTSDPRELTIAKKLVDAAVTAEDKTYDGTADAKVSATVSTGLLEKDVVTVKSISGAFADPNAGSDKSIIIDASSVSLAGEGSANYEVRLPSSPITASILPRPVLVKADDKSSCHGEAIAELTYSLDGSTTLAEGDTLASLGITASTTATSKSNVGEYPITLSGGTANPNYAVTFGEDGTYTIEKPVYRPTEGSGSSWTAGNDEGLTITFKRSVNDGETFKHFTGIRVDGADVAETDYDAVPGSVVVTLHASFLKTLEPGDHTITALFDDGDPAQAAFSVKVTPAPAAKATHPSSSVATRPSSSVAKTSDALPASAPVAALALVAIAAVAALYARRQVR